MEVEVLRGTGDSASLRLDLSTFDAAPAPATALRDIGIVPRQFLLEPVVGSFAEGSAAQRAGLQVGDRLLSIGDRSLHSWNDVGSAVQAQASADAPLALVVERDGVRQPFQVQPVRDDSQAPGRWLLVQEEALADCLDPERIELAGISNRRRWWLVPPGSVMGTCEASAGQRAEQGREEAE